MKIWKWLKTIPKKVLKFNYLGDKYFETKDYMNAIKMYDWALYINKNHLQSLYFKGYKYKNLTR